jgi:lincosamide nucleotidyltransferase B/F
LAWFDFGFVGGAPACAPKLNVYQRACVGAGPRARPKSVRATTGGLPLQKPHNTRSSRHTDVGQMKPTQPTSRADRGATCASICVAYGVSIMRGQTHRSAPQLALDMPNSTQPLLDRLDAIARSLENSNHALALIGLGSIGKETARLDAHSDLDFFAIVDDGHKARYINDLSWLSDVAPVAYHFQNTVDGHKLLYADGIFCEFAVFEQHELKGIPFAAGRIVWKKPHIDDAIATPVRTSHPGSALDINWQLGEALTNLLIGLKRFHRGEKLSASRFMQSYALDRVLELAAMVEQEQPFFKDGFVNERRFEQRFPNTAALLPQFVQGYDRTPQSALAILEFLEKHFDVNKAIAAEIRALCTA